MKYVGIPPNSDSAVAPKVYVDDRYEVLKVDEDYIAGECADQVGILSTPGHMTAGDSSRAKKAAAAAADAAYVPLTDRGATNGVASIGADGLVPAAQTPGVVAVRRVGFKNVDTVFLGASRECTAVNVKEFRVATLTIADPGFPYTPLPFAMIQGGATNGVPVSTSQGTNQYAQITIMRDDDTVFGKTITNSQKLMDYFTVLPYGQTGTTPITINGSCVLNLWIGLAAGSATYHFTNVGLAFYALIYPTM